MEEEESTDDFPVYDAENPKLEVGMTFASPQAFRDVVRHVNIILGCNLTFLKSTFEKITEDL